MWVAMTIASTPALGPPAVTAANGRAAAVDSVWGRDGFGFDDLVDVVNPLQHLPGVAQVYRHLSGDDIGMLPQIAGGLLFGGPVGAASAIVSAGFEAGTGMGPAAFALAALQADSAAPTGASAPPPRVARAYTAPAPHAEPTAAVPAEVAPAGWVPPLSGAGARLLAELERSAPTTAPAESTGSATRG
jgi:hypothetical protein